MHILRKRWKLLSIILLVGVIGVYFWQTSEADPETSYTTQYPEIKPIKKTLDLSGYIDAKEKARLRFVAGGKVVYLGAQEGDTIKKWQTIATIDKATLEKQLAQDLNNYMKERWDWEQTLDDTEDRALPEHEQRVVDKNQWDLTNEVLDVEIRDIAIRNTAITAPFDGILTVSPVTTTGSQLLSTDYFEVINPTTLIFSAQVEEEDVGKVFAGQTAEIYLDAYPDLTLESNVSYVSYTASETSSGTVFSVEFPVTSADISTYRLGMNGDVDLLLDKREKALVIPILALIEKEGKTFVELEQNGEVIEKEVVIGLESEEEVEILSGISEQDLVVIPE